MISPQSLAVAAAAGHLVGRESDLLRFTIRHSFILLLFICILVTGQAYLFKWIIPHYQKLATNTTAVTTDVSNAVTYLLVLAASIILLVIVILLTGKKPANPITK
jgi:lactate permease